jgi:hypothetical protein
MFSQRSAQIIILGVAVPGHLADGGAHRFGSLRRDPEITFVGADT